MKHLSFLLGCVVTSAGIPPQGVAAQEGIFPDKNLAAVVRKCVFEKRDNDQPLVEDDVATISAIHGVGAGIKDLTGLEKCRSLAESNFENNEIQDISAIKDLENLQSLNLARNRIRDIGAVAKLTGLQYVHLAHNRIRDLKPLAKLANLRSLYLSDNQIDDASPLAGLGKLGSLYLDGNALGDISPLAKLEALRSLDLRGNQVADLAPLKKLKEWKYLFLDGNRVTDLSVLIEMGTKDKAGDQRFAPFWSIYLSGNPLTDEAKKTQLAQLRRVAKKVVFKEK
ncbi:MAG: leucine-rich repeat domain-containing protein [Pirellulaceae bacterium]